MKTQHKKKIRLGDLLLEAKVITREQLEHALEAQKRTGHKLGRALAEVGAITEHDLRVFLARRLKIDYIDLSTARLELETVRLLSEVHARRYRALVLQQGPRGLLVGMTDPTDMVAYDELCRLLAKPVQLALVDEADLLRTIDVMYRRTEEIDALAAEVKEDIGEGKIDIDQLGTDEDSAEAPVIKLLQSLFKDAVQIKASDIHVEPDEKLLRIRQRVDGVLHEHTIDGRGVAAALVTRLKLMSGLDIAEKRLPQDGRFSVRVGDRGLDVRLSTMPVQFGESVVLRLLDNAADLMTLEQLGMPAGVLQRFSWLLERPAGMILVTGPTGSGKTTTLYSALNHLNRPGTKIITVEDPVEYRLERVNQVQVNQKIGLDFARVLRTALRQDPDIMLVGEMRDQETVEIGLRAAMTGHLVFSTLHTISAPATVNRLLDMHAAPYLISAALHGVVGQRLVRRVCTACREPAELRPGQTAWLYAQVGRERGEALEFAHGRGCNRCNLTGYQGRIGVYELLEMDGDLTDAVRRSDLAEFLEAANAKDSYVPLVQGALGYAAESITSLEEVMRISGGVDDDLSGELALADASPSARARVLSEVSHG